ncbi:hypothetical protein FRC03_011838 [Tulasnella sp. 419]|nr:hypothetical protein FRC02_000127 [Tulasnella sp. 418]KAG8970039.1 hypothetical protein FRC03_011838 [Tulasnella sp. 419]
MAAPFKRQSPCFVRGNQALPAEVARTLGSLAGVVTCGTDDTIPGVPDVISGGISYSSIDFRGSNLSPVGFALQTFRTPDRPSEGDLALLQNQLNVYLATEAGVRSTGDPILGRLKGAKFFLQFQIARVRTAQGVTNLGPGEDVEHQLGKVLKNAVGASASEIAEVKTLATRLD